MKTSRPTTPRSPAEPAEDKLDVLNLVEECFRTGQVIVLSSPMRIAAQILYFVIVIFSDLKISFVNFLFFRYLKENVINSKEDTKNFQIQ